jgi:hypothetical protein
MRLTVMIRDRDGALVHEDAWHLPNDLPGHPHTWAAAEHDLPPVPAGGTMRWLIDPCTDLSCQIPAAGLPPAPARRRRRGGAAP